MTTDDEVTTKAWLSWLNSPAHQNNTTFHAFAAGRASLQPLIDSLTARIEAQAELLQARAEKPGV